MVPWEGGEWRLGAFGGGGVMDMFVLVEKRMERDKTQVRKYVERNNI